jgi:hypothetical protein
MIRKLCSVLVLQDRQHIPMNSITCWMGEIGLQVNALDL